jgi:hypothetical protein
MSHRELSFLVLFCEEKARQKRTRYIKIYVLNDVLQLKNCLCHSIHTEKEILSVHNLTERI